MLFWFAFLALLCLFGGSYVAIGCTKGQRHRLCRKPGAKGKTPVKKGGKTASKRETRSQSVSSKRYAPNKKTKRSAADLDNSFSARLKKSYEIMTNKSSKSDRLKKSARSPRSDRSGSKRSTRGSEKSVGSQKSERELREGKSKDGGSRREEGSSRRSQRSNSHRSKREEKDPSVDRLRQLQPEDLPPGPIRPPGETVNPLSSEYTYTIPFQSMLTNPRSNELPPATPPPWPPARPMPAPVPPGPPSQKPSIRSTSFSVSRSYTGNISDSRVTRSSLRSPANLIDYYDIPTKPKVTGLQQPAPPPPPVKRTNSLQSSSGMKSVASKSESGKVVGKKEAPSPWAAMLTKKGYAEPSSGGKKSKGSKGSRGSKGSKGSKDSKGKNKKKSKSKSKSKESFTDKLFKAASRRNSSNSDKMAKKPQKDD